MKFFCTFFAVSLHLSVLYSPRSFVIRNSGKMIKSWERFSALQLQSYKCKGKRSSAQEPGLAVLMAEKFEREWQIILQNRYLSTFTTYYNEGHLHCLCGIATCPFTHPDFKFLFTLHLSLCLIAIYSSSLKFKQISTLENDNHVCRVAFVCY